MMNCISIDDEPLAHKILKNYSDRLPSISITNAFHSALDAIDILNTNVIDLIFLDINMPILKGLDFIRTLKNPPMVIITSAYQEYALESYELNIVDYLLKPFSFERFLKATNKAVEINKHSMNRHTPNTLQPAQEDMSSIFIKSDKKTHQIELSEILFLEGANSYVKVHLPGQMIMTYERLSHFDNSLPEKDFIRVHKSYIVAKKKIRIIEGNRIFLDDHEIPIGATYRQSLKDIIRY